MFEVDHETPFRQTVQRFVLRKISQILERLFYLYTKHDPNHNPIRNRKSPSSVSDPRLLHWRPVLNNVASRSLGNKRSSFGFNSSQAHGTAVDVMLSGHMSRTGNNPGNQ